MSAARVRVVFADDHPVYLEGLGRALRQWPEIEVVGEAADGRSALAQIRDAGPDVALIDLQLPELDGLHVLDAVRRDGLATQVVLISAFEDGETIYRAFSLGARGFLPKHSTADEICRAIVVVASGGASIAPHYAGDLASEIHKRRDRDEEPLLTGRELEILRLSAEGLSVREVGERMHLSIATVKTHLQHAYEKLEVNDRTAAVARRCGADFSTRRHPPDQPVGRLVAVRGGSMIPVVTAPGVIGVDALALVGDDRLVQCLDGSERRYVNLDSAASTPALRRVADVVSELLPWYSSVHRGAGTKSQLSTAAFEGARQAVRRFVGAADDQEVILVANTTHAINMLSALLQPGARVLVSPVEHHANMLPWRDHDVEVLPFPASPDELLASVGETLRRGGGEIDLLAVTGASNVTGEVWPIRALASLAHEAGAEIFVDAAQLAPHRAVDLRSLGVDHLAVSGHKLYAPFGAGALVARRARLEAAQPWLKGGGAVRRVTLEDTVWSDPPERHEAGSPNTVGAVALGAACDALAEVGMQVVAEHERGLTDRLRMGLAELPGVRLLELWPVGSCDRLGVVAFVVEGYDDRLLAQILAAEHAIGVRNGRFCAHPFVAELLGAAAAHDNRAGDRERGPGAVRASLGVGSRAEDIDRLLNALEEIITSGPAGHYVPDPDTHDFLPTHDQRAWPEVSFRLNLTRPVPPCG